MVPAYQPHLWEEAFNIGGKMGKGPILPHNTPRFIKPRNEAFPHLFDKKIRGGKTYR
jgi:hypothetical protein